MRYPVAASIPWLAIFVLALAACGVSDPIEREEGAIRNAIADYLRERRSINPDSMQMDLSDVQIDGDRARARATFRSAEMPDGLTFEYQLVRSDGVWEVAASSAQSGHGGMGPPLPEGHPPMEPDAPAGSENDNS